MCKMRQKHIKHILNKDVAHNITEVHTLAQLKYFYCITISEVPFNLPKSAGFGHCSIITTGKNKDKTRCGVKNNNPTHINHHSGSNQIFS